MMQRLKLFLPLLVFVGLGILFYRAFDVDPQALPSALIDKPVPAFSLPTLENPAPITEKQLVGPVALLNVWATWCTFCREEFGYLGRLAKEGVPIYGVNYRDEREAALGWLNELGNPYVMNIEDADGRLGIDLGVRGAPETYVLDAKGVIRFKYEGPVDDKVWQDKIKPVYEQLLQEAR